MLADRIPVAKVFLDVRLAHHRDRLEPGWSRSSNARPSTTGICIVRKKSGAGHQNMSRPFSLLAHRHALSRPRALPEQRRVGGTRAAHAGNRAEPLLQIAVEREISGSRCPACRAFIRNSSTSLAVESQLDRLQIRQRSHEQSRRHQHQQGDADLGRHQRLAQAGAPEGMPCDLAGPLALPSGPESHPPASIEAPEPVRTAARSAATAPAPRPARASSSPDAE